MGDMAKVYESMLKQYQNALNDKIKKGDLRGTHSIMNKITKLKRAAKRHSKK